MKLNILHELHVHTHIIIISALYTYVIIAGETQNSWYILNEPIGMGLLDTFDFIYSKDVRNDFHQNLSPSSAASPEMSTIKN